MRRWATTAVCIAILSARAQAAPVIRVVYLPFVLLPDDLVAENIDEAVHAELVADGQLLVVGASARAQKGDALVVGREPAWLLSARHDIEKGKLDHAISELKKGIAATERKPEAAPVSTIADARLLISVAEFHRGADDEGQKSLEEFARLRPQAKLAAKDYPPLFMRLFDQAKLRWQKRSAAELRIDADAPGTIELDGTLLGAPPLAVERVSPGVHYLALVSGDRQSVKRVEVRSGIESIHFSISGRGHPLAQNAFSTAAKTALARIAREEGAAFVVTGLVGSVAGKHLSAVVVVSGSGQGQVGGVMTLEGEPQGWGGDIRRTVNRLVSLITHGLADDDLNPLLSGLAPSSEAVGHVEMFPAERSAEKKPMTEKSPSEKTAEAPRPLAIRPAASSKPSTEHRDTRSQPLVEPLAKPVVPDTPLSLAEQTPAPAVTTPVYKQWWLWTIVGAAVAGGVTAAVLVSTARVNQVSIHATW